MIGVHGSLIAALKAGLGSDVIDVYFGRRPQQLGALPAAALFSVGTKDIDYQMSGDAADDDDKTKLKTYRVRVEVFHETLEGAELLGEKCEQILESKATQDALRSVSAGDADAVGVYDAGGELYEPYTQFAGLTPDDPLIPHRGVLNYEATIRRDC